MTDILKSISDAWPKISEWLLSTGLKILIILVIGIVVTWLVSFTINRITKKLSSGKTTEEVARGKRIKTVLGALRVLTGTVIWVIIGIMVLGQLGISIGPILAGLGVVGVAVGFGAQNLVKDILAGFFLVVENQLRVGDVVKLGDAVGTVELVNLRITQVRGLNGHLFSIPNGEIKMVENMSMDWSRAVVKVDVGYRSDISKVIGAMEKAAGDIKNDKEYGRHVLETPLIKAIDDFKESSIEIAMWIKTIPAEQWDVGRMARRHIKARFDEAGITIPFPQVTLTLGKEEAELFRAFKREPKQGKPASKKRR